MKKEKSNLALIIATRWRSEVLAQTIDSALKNAVFDNELIIVADCPTWQTLKVIQERKLRFYTVYFAHCNISRSFGGWKAHREYVGFADDDIYFGPRWDEALMEIMKPNIVGSVKKWQIHESVACGYDDKSWWTFKPELLHKQIEENKHLLPDSVGYGQPITHHRETYFKHYGYTFHTSQGHGHEGQLIDRMKMIDPSSHVLKTYKSGMFHWGQGGCYSDPGHYGSEGYGRGLRLCLGCGKAKRNDTHEDEDPNSTEAFKVYKRGYTLCPDCLIAGRKDVGKFRFWDFWSREG